jgi:hyperosmotically inducible protein
MKRAVNLLIAATAIFMAVPALHAMSANSYSAPQQMQGNSRSQDRITREVYHELVMLPQLSIFDHLAYKVDGSNVTLMGAVRNAVLKDEAESSVKKIEGVDHVNNQIEILPASENDDRIRREVARTIFNDPTLFKYSVESVPSIHIIVKNGHVDLEGAVDNNTDKNQAYLKANGVPGVFEVKNNLQVVNDTSKK